MSVVCPICGRPPRRGDPENTCVCVPPGYVYIDVHFDSGPPGMLVPVDEANAYVTALLIRWLSGP